VRVVRQSFSLDLAGATDKNAFEMPLVKHVQTAKRLRRVPRTGFTVIELMIVVAIIGILVILGIPAFLQSRISSQNASFRNTLRLLEQGFELYSLEVGSGNYPADAPPSTAPAGFDEYKPRRFSWDETTPIGGTWDWDRAADRGTKVRGCYAGISVIAPSRTSAQMLKFDKHFDDGTLDEGHFQQHADGYIHIIER
jgi:prepilin-type N-terminal cleavage/methylation domain-containing protein